MGASQRYVAACETCERQTRHAAAADDRCASWCEWVPVPAQQYPADCTGCNQGSASEGASNRTVSTTGCSSFCEWVPIPAQQYPADCTGCNKDAGPSSAMDLQGFPKATLHQSAASGEVSKKSLRGSTTVLPKAVPPV